MSGINKSTIHKILGDPDFNPDSIFGEALQEFILNHPNRIAEDKVALRHLIHDPEAANTIVDAIDVNDPKMLGTFMQTTAKTDGYYKVRTLNRLLERLSQIRPEMINDIFEVIKANAADLPDVLKPHMLGKSIDIFSAEQKNELLHTMAYTGRVDSWEGKDWVVVVNDVQGAGAFINRLHSFEFRRGHDEFFQAISLSAKTILHQGGEIKDMLHEKLMLFCKKKWKAYICFNCGAGCGLNDRGRVIDSNLIKSISGYTLHRKSCDSEGRFPSPWEIFYGVPRQLTFACECGVECSTLSGLTLHKKSCRRC